MRQFLQENVGSLRLERQRGPAVDVVHHLAQAGYLGKVHGVGATADRRAGGRIDLVGHRRATGQIVADAGLGHDVIGLIRLDYRVRWRCVRQ